MRAIVLSGFGGLESLVIKEIPDPEPKAGHVLIAVRAFGVNHAETPMRKGEWTEAAEVSELSVSARWFERQAESFEPVTKWPRLWAAWAERSMAVMRN
jgi:hypothetical protein